MILHCDNLYIAELRSIKSKFASMQDVQIFERKITF